MEQWQSQEVNEIAAALVKAQTAMKPAKREATNPFFKSTYADLSTCWEATDPFRANGIAITQCPMPSEIPATIALDTMLLHTSGQWIRSRFIMPIAKMDPQGAGSAITYARRYALGCLTGLVTDEDDDGNSAAKPEKGPVTRDRLPAVPTPQAQDNSGSFTWRLGKWKDSPITEIDSDYLDWFKNNGQRPDHVDAARMELDRRNAQLAMEEEDAMP